MKTYEEIEQDINKEIKNFETKKVIVNRLLETIKKENLGMNQVVLHKEWYDTQ